MLLATTPAETHYAPEERLDLIDIELIATARTSIDLASYALTDRIVIEALDAAQRCGVAIRIVLDPRERHDFVRLGDLADTVRIKRGGALMHLKAYEIDGQVLRTGSANFSRSGENAQDNDLIVIRDAGRRGTDDRICACDPGDGAAMSLFYEFFCGTGMARAGLGPDWACLFANDIDHVKAAAYAANWGVAGPANAEIVHSSALLGIRRQTRRDRAEPRRGRRAVKGEPGRRKSNGRRSPRRRPRRTSTGSTARRARRCRASSWTPIRRPPSKFANAAAPNAAAEPQQWLTRADFRAEVKKQIANGDYPDKSWGRWENGVAQSAAHWTPRPSGKHFAFYGTDVAGFNARNAELLAKGLTLQYDNTFQDCDGSTRHQALWRKGG